MTNKGPETDRQIFTGRVDAYGMVGGFRDVTPEAKKTPPKKSKGIPQDRNSLIPPPEAIEHGATMLVGAKVDASGMHGGTWVRPSRPTKGK